MPELTMKQIARASNFAIHYGLRPRDVIEAFQKTRRILEAAGFEDAEDTFYALMRETHG